MDETKKKKTRRKWPVILVIVVLLLGILAGTLLSTTGVLDGLLHSKPSPTPYTINGEMNAVVLQATGTDTSEDGYRAYFNEAVQYAAANNLNTIIYEGRSGITVHWRDKYFPMDSSVTQYDTFFNKSFDPLAILIDTAALNSIQVYLQVDALSASGYSTDMTGAVAKLTPTADFAASDTDYTGLLRKSLTDLPQTYGLAGILLAGLPADADGASLFTAIQSDLTAAGYTTALAVKAPEYDSTATTYATYFYQNANPAFVQIELSDATGFVDMISSLQAAGNYLLTQPASSNSSLVLFAAAGNSGYQGAVLSSYPAAMRSGTEIAALLSATTQLAQAKPTGYTMPTTLEVTNPAYGFGTSSNSLYIVGTSNPDLPLYLDGEEITNRTEGGLFGILVQLEAGENYFEFSQEDATVTYLAKYNVPTGSGSTSTAAIYDTREPAENEGAVVTFQYAGAYTGWSDGGLNETFYADAVAKVTAVVTKNGADYAYQISSGDWLYAETAAATAYIAPAFTGLEAADIEGGEYINFIGSGTPAAYIAYDEDKNALDITMYDTSFTLAEGFTSTLVQAASVAQEGDATILHLQLNSIWGYQLEYTENTTRLYLKQAPQLSSNSAQPLEGITIMLDPGHGDQDYGLWAGIVGTESSIEGPYEKNLNLTVAQTTAYRLEQLGATVVMTRNDDSFTTIYERLAYENEVKPDIYISFHHNALDPYQDLSTVQGTEVYYYHPYSVANSKGLAENLVQSITNAIGTQNRGAQWSTYVVTRTTVCPSVLCEFGFMGNPAEFEKLIATETLYREADAIVNAILATLQGETIASGA